MSTDQKTYNDKELLLRIATGDEQAFTSLYSYYQPRLFQYVFPFALSRSFAEEIVQDVLFKIWTRRETLLGILSLEKYLFRMAKNRLLDHLKREATHQKHLLQLPIADNIPAYADEGLLLKEYHQIALDAINKLSQKQQEVFLLRHREDMTIDEIAAATGSSRAAVQKNLVRAVRFIKQQLVHYGDWALPIIFLLLSVG